VNVLGDLIDPITDIDIEFTINQSIGLVFTIGGTFRTRWNTIISSVTTEFNGRD
jgi:hypothetical protein